MRHVEKVFPLLIEWVEDDGQCEDDMQCDENVDGVLDEGFLEGGNDRVLQRVAIDPVADDGHWDVHAKDDEEGTAD